VINIGLVGVGAVGRVHLSIYAELENARVVALCDKIPERAKGSEEGIAFNIGTVAGSTVQARAYTNYRRFLNDPDIEVVDICLPTDLHSRFAVAALEAGKHVLCEKPMARSVAQCDRMIAAAEASGRALMVAHCIRFWPEYVVLKEMVDSGKYGKVTSAVFRRLSLLPIWSSENWIITPKRSGGALLDLHVHDIDFIAHLFGMPAWVASSGIEDEHGVGEVVTQYGYPGQTVVAEGGWYYPASFPFRMNFVVRMERATAEWDSRGGPLTVYPEGGDALTPDLPPGNGYTREIAYFLDCVSRGSKPEVVTPRDARESVRIALAEARSIRSGRRVTL